MRTRTATMADIPQLVPLLLADAGARAMLDPKLWAVAADAEARIGENLRAELGPAARPGPRMLWLVAETGESIVGVTHSMIIPPPGIYAVPTAPGLLLDDCFVAPAAPAGTAEALLLATEAALQQAGAGDLIASCPKGGAWSALYARHGYEPVTDYLGKAGFEAQPAPDGVRSAVVGDVPAIVALSARHRRTLAELNPRFWPTHAEADARFGRWMQISLTLRDRDMLVAGPTGDVAGYIIAQPASPLHFPAAHDVKPLGTIDDFYAGDFAEVSAPGRGADAEGLLSAAETAFARRGITGAIAVCPTAWASKSALLERAGYRRTKVWLLKR
ncbi:hypothetical protein [uncultured Phenylobacterium sp.]|uniref:GNAT family N-acetyltransferase n=1 Tax=uncultured Phenylobacterium sp. TaxID=349273 RepID=UPI0025F1CDD8|nr:hypothetical protein [uncultured Phenylobacterium sp.]